ncbi:MAG: XDD3 family exosortase-dependent surface protein, partial [Prochlorotrichaceae cyanobacterium]
MQQANLQLNLQSNLQKVIQGTIAAGVVCLAGQSAQAGTLYQGWNYAIDSFNDGYNNGTIGAASNYELYGLAVKQAGNQVTFAINSDTPLGGFYSSTASGNRIAYGDLFLNFTGQTLANAQGNLFGIRFDDQSDNSAGFSLGLYSGVLAQKVSLFNNGFNTLSQHRNSVANKGGTASLG